MNDKWQTLKRKLEGLHMGYKENEAMNYVTVGSKAVEAVQSMMKELERKDAE